MKQVKHINEKAILLKHILSINDLGILNQLREFLEEIYDNLKITDFDHWNEQFEGSLQLNEPLEEYGVSLGEFRSLIYEAENGDNVDVDKFHDKLKRIYNASEENN